MPIATQGFIIPESGLADIGSAVPGAPMSPTSGPNSEPVFTVGKTYVTDPAAPVPTYGGGLGFKGIASIATIAFIIIGAMALTR